MPNIKWKKPYLTLAALVISGLGMLLLVYLGSDRDATLDAAIKTGEQLAQQGREDIPACTGRHGASGEGKREMPRFRVYYLVMLLNTSLMAQEVDPLEVRPSLVEPRVSLPTELTTVPVVNPGESMSHS